ncbi:MFS transporter [Melittangium boletus]|nr:MFS transporter [Melittangium boletus]
MAISAGLAVANLYYHQPLLGDIGRTFQASDRAVGLVPTASQVGYALGLLLIVPLGDSLERRRIIVLMCGLVSLALLGMALAPSLPWLVAASALVGVTTVVPQLLVPFAAHLAPAEQRGRVVGLVMSGLLIGILLSRTVGGLLGVRFGWRAMFWIAAGLMVGLAVLLRLALPRQPASAHVPYGALLRSLGVLVREEPVLRLHSWLGALSFASFSSFWATLVLHLQALPQHYGARTAGMFGVVGVVGAIAAPLVGRYTDKGGDRRINAFSMGLMAASFVVFGVAGQGLWGIAAGVLLLDLGAQANHISNQTRIYALRPEARNRLNTVYMVTCFVGGALGAWLGSIAWGHAGWTGVCAVGLGLPLLGLLVLGLVPPGRRMESAARDVA